MTDTNPYEAPTAALLETAVPESFRQGAVSAKQLGWAGWIAIVYVIVSIPMVVLSFYAGAVRNESLEFVSRALSVVTSMMTIYLFLMLKKFIEARFEISGLGKYVYSLVLLNVVLLVLSMLMGRQPESGSLGVATISYFALFFPYGIVAILFGKKLLSIDTPYSYLRPFAWLTILGGIALASIILFVVAVPLGIIADVLMALLFFAGRKELLSAAESASA